MKQLGASRVVMAREMSFAEIREIHDKVGIEIESFVHGALCYCYSGNVCSAVCWAAEAATGDAVPSPAGFPMRSTKGSEIPYRVRQLRVKPEGSVYD